MDFEKLKMNCTHDLERVFEAFLLKHLKIHYGSTFSWFLSTLNKWTIKESYQIWCFTAPFVVKLVANISRKLKSLFTCKWQWEMEIGWCVRRIAVFSAFTYEFWLTGKLIQMFGIECASVEKLSILIHMHVPLSRLKAMIRAIRKDNICRSFSVADYSKNK